MFPLGLILSHQNSHSCLLFQTSPGSFYDFSWQAKKCWKTLVHCCTLSPSFLGPEADQYRDPNNNTYRDHIVEQLTRETQPPTDQRLSSSIFTCSFILLSVPQSVTSLFNEVYDQTNHKSYVMIWSWQCVREMIDKYKDRYKGVIAWLSIKSIWNIRHIRLSLFFSSIFSLFVA